MNKKKLLGLLAIGVILSIIYLGILGIHTAEGVPATLSHNGQTIMLSAEFEVFDEKMFFTDGVGGIIFTKELMTADASSKFKLVKKLGIKNIERIRRGGTFLYLFCEGDKIVIYDIDKKATLNEVHLREQVTGMKQNGRVQYSLLSANEEGAFVIMNNEEENWIILVNSIGAVEVLKKLNTMGGTISQLTAKEQYMFFSYASADKEKDGTYCFNRNTNQLVKRSDMRCSTNETSFPAFIWEDQYGFVLYSKLYLFPFEGGEVTEVDLKYSSYSICVNGDYLYCSKSDSLERYNLRTDVYEIADNKKNLIGVIRVDDERVYMAYRAPLTNLFFFTKVYIDDLSDYNWRTRL